jgi:hypothetical protein
MFTNLLNRVIVWVYGFYKYMVTMPDYYIENVNVIYTLDQMKSYDIKDKLWKDESKYWDRDTDEVYSDLTYKDYMTATVPENVSKTILRIKYWCNGSIYKLITENMKFRLPDDLKSGFSFSIPLGEAWLVDHDDKPVRDITKKVKRYAGPKNDFHGEKVRIRDMLYYTEDTLKKDYPAIRLINALGMSKSVSTIDGYTTDLRLP